jgi:hypothetical protein
VIVILGLIILLAAVIVGMAGVLGNGGGAHMLTDDGFAVFGYHVTGSTGTLFLYGIVVGAVALFGLTLLLAGARRTSRRGSAARRGLRQSRREPGPRRPHRRARDRPRLHGERAGGRYAPRRPRAQPRRRSPEQAASVRAPIRSSGGRRHTPGVADRQAAPR